MIIKSLKGGGTTMHLKNATFAGKRDIQPGSARVSQSATFVQEQDIQEETIVMKTAVLK